MRNGNLLGGIGDNGRAAMVDMRFEESRRPFACKQSKQKKLKLAAVMILGRHDSPHSNSSSRLSNPLAEQHHVFVRQRLSAY